MGEEGEQLNNTRIITEETAVEICESQECMDVFQITGRFPVLHGANFLGVHFKSYPADN
jgi:hypothetical protein